MTRSLLSTPLILLALLALSPAIQHAQTPAPATPPAAAQPEPQASPQKPDIEENANAASAPTPPRTEAPVDGLVRKDTDTIAFTAPGMRPVDLRDFDFNGEPVPTGKLHLRQLSPGVLEITSLAYAVGFWRFHVTDLASYYGLGERFDALNHTHTTVRNASQDNGGPKGSSTYKPIPFFMSTTGYGLWVDTTADASFDLNSTLNREIIVDTAGAKLRIVLFTGPKFPTILEHFTALEGRAILPPYWAFAPWKSRDFHSSEKDVFEDVAKNRELGLPASVIVLDSPWATGYNSYKLNPKQFADPPGMVKYIHGEGYKLVLWHTPWINNKSGPPTEPGFEGKIDVVSDNYEEAKANGYFVKNFDGSAYVAHWWKGDGSLIDFTNPSAKRWWQDQLRLAIAAGADGFKDDDGEGSFIGPVKFADGSDLRLMRNKYANLYNNAVEEVIQQDLKGNGVVFDRSATVGANGLSFLWGGDNEASFSPENGLPSVILAGLNAGLSGMPMWTADLGGYRSTASTPDARLLMRWTEYAAFSPIIHIHSQANISPWNFDRNSGGTAALDNYRRYAVLHMSLFPYRYAAAQEAAKTGMPIMRALVLDYQNDERARESKDEYLFGPDLLVAPVIDENTSRVVYLPAGSWIDLFDGTQFKGGQVILAPAPLNTSPVYAKLGTILPKIPEDIMTLVPQSESGNTKVKSMDDRRIYELVGPAAPEATSITDFEGRTVVRSGDSLTIAGDSVAHIVVRWKFTHPHSASMNGKSLPIKTDAHGDAYTEFDYVGSTSVSWQ